MAISIISNPARLGLSFNKLGWLVESSLANSITCRLLMESSFNAGDFTTVYTETKPIDNNSQAVFDFADIISAELSFQVPDPTVSTLTQASTMARNYSIEASDNQVTFTPSVARTAIKGAWPFLRYEHGKSLTTERKYLSIKNQSDRIYYPGQYEWIWLVNDSDVAITLELTITYTDGSTSQSNQAIGNAQSYRPFSVPIHQAFDSLLDNSKTAQSLEVKIMDHTFTYQISYEHYPFIKEIYFVNSLGGIDSLIMYGRGQRTDQGSSGISQRYLDYNYSTRLGQNIRHNVVVNTSYKVSIGYRSEKERDAARDIFYARQAWIREGANLVPIIIQNPRTREEREGEFRYTFELDYSYAFENHSPV